MIGAAESSFKLWYKYLIDLAMSKMVMQLSNKGGPGFLLVVPLAEEAKFA